MDASSCSRPSFKNRWKQWIWRQHDNSCVSMRSTLFFSLFSSTLSPIISELPSNAFPCCCQNPCDYLWPPQISSSMMFSVQSGAWLAHTREYQCHAGWIWVTTVITRRQWQLDKHPLADVQRMFQTHSCSTSRGVKLLSFLISWESGCKKDSRPFSPTTASKKKLQPSRDPLRVR